MVRVGRSSSLWQVVATADPVVALPRSLPPHDGALRCRVRINPVRPYPWRSGLTAPASSRSSPTSPTQTQTTQARMPALNLIGGDLGGSVDRRAGDAGLATVSHQFDVLGWLSTPGALDRTDFRQRQMGPVQRVATRRAVPFCSLDRWTAPPTKRLFQRDFRLGGCEQLSSEPCLFLGATDPGPVAKGGC